MPLIHTLLDGPCLQVTDYRCTAGPHEPCIEEMHPRYCMSIVSEGSFGVEARGRIVELVPGSIFQGYPGDTFTCHHDHHAGGDRCLSFDFTAEWIDEVGGDPVVWRSVGARPDARLRVIGAIAQAAAVGESAVGLDEVAYALATNLVDRVAGSRRQIRPSSRDLRRASDAARWIERCSAQQISLNDAAAVAGLSTFHFLRVFRAVFGLTPHQYLISCRLRAAAYALIATDLPVTGIAYDSGFMDLSNFVRSFGRIAGMSPSAFRSNGRRDSKIFQALPHRAT